MKVIDRKLLFHKNQLSEFFRSQNIQMATDIERFTDDYLLNTSLDDLLNYFEQKYLLEVPVLDESGVEFDQQDKKVEVSDFFDRDRRVLINGTRYTFFIPFTGDESLFYCQASTYSCSPPYGSVEGGQLVFVYDVSADTPAEVIKNELNSNLQAIKEALQWTATDVGREYNPKIRCPKQN